MDVLVRKADKAVVQTWGGAARRVDHPEKPGGALAAGVGDKRPIDFGDWVLARATEDKPAFDPATQVREGPTVAVADDLSVTAAWTVKARPPADVFAERAAALSDQLDAVLARGAAFDGARFPADDASRGDVADVIGFHAKHARLPNGEGDGGVVLRKRDAAQARHDLDAAGWANLHAALGDYAARARIVADDHLEALKAILADAALTNQEKNDRMVAHDLSAGWPS